MITDEMIHGAPARPRRHRFGRRSHRRQRSARSRDVSPVVALRGESGYEIEPAPQGPFIADDTSLVPDIVARGVWEEACAYLNVDLPREWMGRLTRRAELIYQRNARVRARLRGRGNSGRDWLWTFMRHWLTALLHWHQPLLFNRLPADFSRGCQLPSPIAS
jgi:hypothetical protein